MTVEWRFALRKATVTLALPLGLFFLAYAVGLATKSRKLLGLAFAMLLVASLPVTADWLVARLEVQYPPMRLEQCPSADAIVALGGMVSSRWGNPREFEWGESVDRFEEAVKLLRAGKAPVVVFTGARTPWTLGEENEGERLRRAAIEHGAPPERVVVTGTVDTTAAEAEAIRKLAQERRWRRVILVTSAMHMPRAMLLFRRAPVDITPYPVDYRQRSPGEALSLLSFLPQAAALAKTDAALREHLALAYYRLSSDCF